MKRITLLLSIVFIAVAGISTNHNVAASNSESTIILRVTKADSGKSLDFTGWYQIDDNPTRVHIRNRSTRLGIKLETSSLTATFRKLSGESDLSVEAIAFIGEQEIGNASATGKVVEVDVRREGEAVRLTARPVERN